MGAGAPPRTAAPAAAGALSALLYLAYPLVVYFGHTRLGTGQLAALLLAVYAASLLVRARGARRRDLLRLALPHLPVLGLFALALALRERRVLLVLPSAASLYLFAVFAWTLRRGPPMIERFARAVEDDLPPFTHPYCRKVTVVWCAFLLAHAGLAALLALAAPLAWWALYTGVVFYVLLGALFAGEFVVRKLWFRYYGAGAADRVLARLFPAERSANGRRSLAYVQRRKTSEVLTPPNAKLFETAYSASSGRSSPRT